MEVRLLGPADVPLYRELMLHASKAAPNAFRSTPEERAAQPDEMWLRRIADPQGRGIAFGAEVGGRLVGTAALEFSTGTKTNHKAMLLGMFVREEFRGQGLGLELLRRVLDAARERPSVRHISLSVTEGNRAAIGLYERCGFRAFGLEPMAMRTPSGF